MNWQDVATALWLAETDTEREQADQMYRAQMRVTLYGGHGTLTARAVGPIDPGQAVAYVGPMHARPHQEPGFLEREYLEGRGPESPTPEGLRPGHPAHGDGPAEGDIRSNAAGDGVEQFRAGIWQDVDPVDLFRYQRQTVDAQRGAPDPTPEVDPASLPPVVRPVPDAETAYRHEVVLQQRRAAAPTTRPAPPPEPQNGPVVGSDTLADGHAAQARSDGSLKAQPSTPSVCREHTPDGPCGLAPNHPVGPMFPGYHGHMHTGD